MKKQISKCPPLLARRIAMANRLNPTKPGNNKKIAFDRSENYLNEFTDVIDDFEAFVLQHRQTLQTYFDSSREFYSKFGIDPQRHLDIVVNDLVIDVFYQGPLALKNPAGLTDREVEHFKSSWLHSYVTKNGYPFDVSNIGHIFFDLRATRKILLRVIEMIKQSNGEVVRQSYAFEDLGDPYTIVAEDKAVKVELHPAFNDLMGHDLAPLGVCIICGEIFWSKRRKSIACSKSCYSVLRQQLYRDRNRERINERRRENYRFKKFRAQRVSTSRKQIGLDNSTKENADVDF